MKSTQQKIWGQTIIDKKKKKKKKHGQTNRRVQKPWENHNLKWSFVYIHFLVTNLHVANLTFISLLVDRGYVSQIF